MRRIKRFGNALLDGVPPAERNARHDRYDRYITAEVVPFIRSHCHDSRLRVMTNGCSMGAYHAVNFFLRHPDLFAGTIALSGLYRLDRFVGDDPCIVETWL